MSDATQLPPLYALVCPHVQGFPESTLGACGSSKACIPHLHALLAKHCGQSQMFFNVTWCGFLRDVEELEEGNPYLWGILPPPSRSSEPDLVGVLALAARIFSQRNHPFGWDPSSLEKTHPSHCILCTDGCVTPEALELQFLELLKAYPKPSNGSQVFFHTKNLCLLVVTPELLPKINALWDKRRLQIEMQPEAKLPLACSALMGHLHSLDA